MSTLRYLRQQWRAYQKRRCQREPWKALGNDLEGTQIFPLMCHLMDSVFPMCSPRMMRLPPQIHFMVSDIRPPWALTLPLNSQDIGTSRWQLAIESYTYFRPIRKGSPLPQLCRFSAAGN